MKTLLKWSVADYHHMIQSGIFGDRSVELLEGDIVAMSPETPLHYSTAKRGTQYLEQLLSDRAEVRFNGPITLVDSEPEPDIAIVRLPESLYRDRHPGAVDIYWLIEVANTSLTFDLNFKAAIYAAAGIPEYWVLDLTAKQLIVQTNPDRDRYQTQQSLTTGTIAPLAFPTLQVSVDRLFS
jgi:Uma2 family endonuclease